MTFEEAVAALDARTNYEASGQLVAPTRERIEALVDMLDHPERGFPVVHVTGTNGKTTAVRAAAEVLGATGLRVATFTSPHVSSIRERFTYGGEPISESDFVEGWRELAPYLDHFDSIGKRITWFEAATALAFVWFADKAVDAAVIEVGMGGTWDATNVVDADVAVLTDIGVDHLVLGSTPAETARDKVGIVKRGSIIVTSKQLPEVTEVIEARAIETTSPILEERVAFEIERRAVALGGQNLSIRLGKERYDDVFLPMFGEQFARDTVIGAAAARALIGDVALDPDVVRDAFARIRVPGRMEIAHRSPLVVLDGAHNAPAARALATAFPAAFTVSRLRLVVSVMADKDLPGVLGPLVALADEVIVTRNHSPRAAALETLADEVRALGTEPSIVADVADALSVAIERSEDSDGVLVAGSLYTVGDARAKLLRAT